MVAVGIVVIARGIGQATLRVIVQPRAHGQRRMHAQPQGYERQRTLRELLEEVRPLAVVVPVREELEMIAVEELRESRGTHEGDRALRVVLEGREVLETRAAVAALAPVALQAQARTRTRRSNLQKESDLTKKLILKGKESS